MRPVSSSTLLGLLLFVNPLSAGLATAYQDATHLYLENDVLKIAVLRTTGNLDGIIHKQSGVNLQTNNVNNRQAIWAMGLSTPSVPFMTNFNTRSFTGTLSTTTTEASLRLTWQGLIPFGVSLPNVAVHAQISVRTDSQFSYWAI